MDENYFDGSLLAHDEHVNKSKCRGKEVNNNPSVGFECNICLDPVQDAVVTICGHLYCWKCIYKWIHLESEDQMVDQRQRRRPQCPVCKAYVSERRLIPLYAARGDETDHSELHGSNLGIVIPPRPSSSYYMGNTQIDHPNCRRQVMVGGMNGEMVYERMLGNSMSYDPNSYGSESQRLRRHYLVETEKSLSKLCLFLFCFVIYCLVLF